MSTEQLGLTENRVLALAGLFQAAWQVDQLATRGRQEPGAFETSVRSIFKLNPETTSDIFGSTDAVRLGLELVHEALSGGGTEAGNTLRYVINLIQLERSYQRNAEMPQILRSRLQQLIGLHEQEGGSGEQLLRELDTVYQDTLSTLPNRIQVQGEAMFLRNDDHVHRIRALLLAGLRSAALWRQKGGSRWQLLFNRSRMQRACRKLLDA